MSMPLNTLSRLTDVSLGSPRRTRQNLSSHGSQVGNPRCLSGAIAVKDWLPTASIICWARRNGNHAEATRLRRAVLARVGIEDIQAAAPRHLTRVFLCEETTGWYLSVTQDEERTWQHDLLLTSRNGISCVMTEEPVSLFVCHRGVDTSGAATVDFEHEGLPALGSFLSACRSWGNALGFPKAGSSESLLCEKRGSISGEEFLWHPNSTIQHVSTGRWLYMDPSVPGSVTLHASKKSVWVSLPATS